MWLIGETEADVVLLDCDEVAGGGREAIRLVREISSIPILALSLRGDEDAAAAALDCGADDYIRKRFGTKELLARVKNALRRRAAKQGKPVVLIGPDLEIDLIYRRVRSQGQDVHLGRRPYEVLRVLTENAGKVTSHETILRSVWGAHSIDRIRYPLHPSTSLG